MKNFILQRYYLHLIIGFCLGYDILAFTDFDTFLPESKLAMILAMAILTFCIGAFWEWLQGQVSGNIADPLDVAFSGIGGAIGVTLSLFIFDNVYLFYLNLATIVYLIGKEIYRVVKK
jgi:hypothetical protein